MDITIEWKLPIKALEENNPREVLLHYIKQELIRKEQTGMEEIIWQQR